ncbi:hypothetical protein ACOME3_009609 [Neoechinorhynchus agilis]
MRSDNRYIRVIVEAIYIDYRDVDMFSQPVVAVESGIRPPIHPSPAFVIPPVPPDDVVTEPMDTDGDEDRQFNPESTFIVSGLSPDIELEDRKAFECKFGFEVVFFLKSLKTGKPIPRAVASRYSNKVIAPRMHTAQQTSAAPHSFSLRPTVTLSSQTSNHIASSCSLDTKFEEFSENIMSLVERRINYAIQGLEKRLAAHFEALVNSIDNSLSGLLKTSSMQLNVPAKRMFSSPPRRNNVSRQRYLCPR